MFWQSLTVVFRNSCMKICTMIGIQHAITLPFFKCGLLWTGHCIALGLIFHSWDETKTDHSLKLVSGRSRITWMNVFFKSYKAMPMWGVVIFTARETSSPWKEGKTLIQTHMGKK